MSTERYAVIRTLAEAAVYRFRHLDSAADVWAMTESVALHFGLSAEDLSDIRRMALEAQATL
jgi:hypothetical protein